MSKPPVLYLADEDEDWIALQAGRGKREKVAKRLSRAFGNKKARQNQLVARLKRKRGYAKPVPGGTGKQSRSKKRSFRKHLPGQHDQKSHGNRGGAKRGKHASGVTNPTGERVDKHYPPKQDHISRCYEISGQMMMDVLSGTLIHGIIRHPISGDVAHGWVVLDDGYVFEPTTDSVYHPEDFEDLYDPVTIEEYSPDKTLTMLRLYKHWGPWDDASNEWEMLYWGNIMGSGGIEFRQDNHRDASQAATDEIVGTYDLDDS